MILLLGGTSEAAPLARDLAEAGYRVLVSTATSIAQERCVHPAVTDRTGPLDREKMDALISRRGIRAIVDCTHPYAARVRSTARQAAMTAVIPYFTFIRPGSASGEEGVLLAGGHEEAAKIACSLRVPVFLTTGSRNLEPYVRESRRAGIKLIVRVLPERESRNACAAAGIAAGNVIAERGPFSAERNQEVIRQFEIGVLVTKDSGKSGGVQEKLEAARREGCRVVVIRRPEKPGRDAYEDQAELVAAVIASVPKG